MLRWEQRHHADRRLLSLVSGHPPFSLIPRFIWGQDSSYPVFPCAMVPCLPTSAHAHSRVWVLNQGPSGALVASRSREHGSLSQWSLLLVGAKA